jgi:hypothetical protein
MPTKRLGGDMSTEREWKLAILLGMSEINAFIVGATNAEAAGALSIYVHRVSNHHISKQLYRSPIIL